MSEQVKRFPTKAISIVASLAALVALLLYMRGTIGGHKVQPGLVAVSTADGGSRNTVVVAKRQVTDVVEWPGSVRSHEIANVAAKVMARVLEVRVKAGTAVKQGDILAVLDDREVRARAAQARAALTAAEAQSAQAQADLRRSRLLIQKQATTPQDLEAAEARAKANQAQAAQARDALSEVEVLSGDTALRAPFDGVVAERLVDPGDMAVPGKPLVVIQNPESLRLEVAVGEQCAPSLSLGQEALVHLESLQRDVTGNIDTIAPVADPQSRTFLVKVSLPPQPGLRPGTFATLRVACGTHAALLVPVAAVRRSGQLESVDLMTDGHAQTRHVRTGKVYGTDVEVLSGLNEGQRVALGEGAP